MSTPLLPGDRCYRIVNGKKLRGVVADYLPMPMRGQSGRKAPIPFVRKKNVVWVDRGDLRKLPPLRPGKKAKPSQRRLLIDHLQAKIKDGSLTLREAVEALHPPVKPVTK